MTHASSLRSWGLAAAGALSADLKDELTRSTVALPDDAFVERLKRMGT